MVRYAGIVYTRHARDQMAERGITESLVVAVPADPDRAYLTPRGLVAERLVGGKPWRVVYAEEPGADLPVVRTVTVYRIDKLKAP